MKSLSFLVKKLRSVPAIKIAVLFGSHATGRTRPYSDIDICVMGSDASSETKALELGSEQIDISLFHRLPLYIQYRVFRDGKVLLNRDEKLFTKLKFWTITRYLDEKHWRDRLVQKVLA